MVKILIGMETSGKLRSRFAALGHSVVSCDLLPADDGCGYDPIEMTGHYAGDILAFIDMLQWGREWPDLAIFHPDCTTHTVSSAWALKDPDYDRWPEVGYHQKLKPETLVGQARRDEKARQEALILNLISLPIERKIIENPISTLGKILGTPSDIAQPWEFGDNASKATCLWAFDRNGKLLHGWGLDRDPSKRVHGRGAGRKMIERWDNQTDNGQNKLSPDDLRWKARSKTYDGIADAIVDAALNWRPQPDMFDLTGA